MTHLETCDNAITNVVCENDGETYNIFVFCGNEKVNCLKVEGEDSYYGTGYHLTVRKGIDA